MDPRGVSGSVATEDGEEGTHQSQPMKSIIMNSVTLPIAGTVMMGAMGL